MRGEHKIPFPRHPPEQHVQAETQAAYSELNYHHRNHYRDYQIKFSSCGLSIRETRTMREKKDAALRKRNFEPLMDSRMDTYFGSDNESNRREEEEEWDGQKRGFDNEQNCCSSASLPASKIIYSFVVCAY